MSQPRILAIIGLFALAALAGCQSERHHRRDHGRHDRHDRHAPAHSGHWEGQSPAMQPAHVGMNMGNGQQHGAHCQHCQHCQQGHGQPMHGQAMQVPQHGARSGGEDPAAQRQRDWETLEKVHAEVHARLDRIEERLQELERSRPQSRRGSGGGGGDSRSGMR
jgi:hypothetical protein